MQNERIIMQTETAITFLIKKVVDGKNGVYYLYTFMSGDNLYTFYSKENYNLETNSDYNLNFSISTYQGNNNLIFLGVVNG